MPIALKELRLPLNATHYDGFRIACCNKVQQITGLLPELYAKAVLPYSSAFVLHL